MTTAVAFVIADLMDKPGRSIPRLPASGRTPCFNPQKK
jgi:hypothetical protein